MCLRTLAECVPVWFSASSPLQAISCQWDRFVQSCRVVLDVIHSASGKCMFGGHAYSRGLRIHVKFKHVHRIRPATCQPPPGARPRRRMHEHGPRPTGRHQGSPCSIFHCLPNHPPPQGGNAILDESKYLVYPSYPFNQSSLYQQPPYFIDEQALFSF